MAVTIDPHKTLYTPYNNGAVLFKNAEDHALLSRNIKADYLQFQAKYEQLVEDFRAGRGNLGEKRIEGSMSAGPILSTVAVLRTLGKEGLATIYDLTLDRTNYLYERISSSPYLEPKHKPELNMLCFTLNQGTQDKLGLNDPEEMNRFINRTRVTLDLGIRREGGYYFSSTNLPDDTGKQSWVYRACIMHPRTTDSIIDNAISSLETLVEASIKN